MGRGASRLWGMTAEERHRRLLSRAGVSRIVSLSEAPADGSAVLLRAEWVLEPALVAALAQQPGILLTTPDGDWAAASGRVRDLQVLVESGRSDGLAPRTSVELTSGYNSALRRRGAPLLMRLQTDNVRDVEARLFSGSYKGVTDIITKHVWPRPARIVTRWCALAGISPNQVTLASLALVVAAFALFWSGAFGLGLVAAWAMTFLDTVDGKLARVTLTSSRFGDVFDHGIDLIHPPFWWWAWIVGLGAAGFRLPAEMLVLAVVLGGYVVQRLIEGAFLALYKLEVHSWRPFDSWFRLITARRNPNLVLLTLGWAAGRPDLGMLAVAVWTALSLAVHLVQLGQAQLAGRRAPLTSWMSA